MNAPDPRPIRPARERHLPFSGWWPVVWGVLAGLVLRYIYSGMPGSAYAAMLDSFIMGSPLVVGAVTVYVAELKERRSWGYYFTAPVLATLIYVACTLLLIIEGWICAILIIPLFTLLGGLAGLLMGAICRVTNWPKQRIVSCIALLPLLGGAIEHHVPNPQRVRVQTRELFVAAPPARVWRELIDARDIAPGEVDSAWMFRIGVPLPSAGAGESRGAEHLRHITMGRGAHFDQVAVEWRANELVTWQNRFRPDSFPPGALDDHVRIGGEYFDVGDTTYALTPEGSGTRLTVHMRYRVSTHFNWYAGPLADLLVGNFAETVLGFYGRRAEMAQAAGPARRPL